MIPDSFSGTSVRRYNTHEAVLADDFAAEKIFCRYEDFYRYSSAVISYSTSDRSDRCLKCYLLISSPESPRLTACANSTTTHCVFRAPDVGDSWVAIDRWLF
ncbi:hypothetical protein E2C01_071573 [Portunus trituberculatus]|uniref:Uncharacterized protein n=1 Tax=Portunus trituberculatus TaxID=210409 RepID=A0A5B7I8C5_PORTR|nr:hypothetical protein [Portunus trituberculatus]